MIEDAPYLLEPMIDGFMEEASGSVRLEMLTAAVKLFFWRPPEMQHMLGRLLQKAIQESAHPDVRDRALLYYRLLEHSPDAARDVICACKEVVQEFQEEMDAESRDRIFEEFNTLSIVYKQPAAKFILSKTPSAMLGACKMQPPPMQGDAPVPSASPAIAASSPPVESPAPPAVHVADVDTADLLGDALGSTASAPPPPSAPSSDLFGVGDLLGGLDPMVSDPVPPAPPSFALMPNATMSGPDFEARWTQLPQQSPQQRQMRPTASLTTAAVEETLRRAGFVVIASGAPAGALKFYFFAQQASGPAPANPVGGIWFLTELVMVPGASAQCSIKAENAQAASVERYSALLWDTLSSFVA